MIHFFRKERTTKIATKEVKGIIYIQDNDALKMEMIMFGKCT